jgi:hypothetical protein
MLSSIFRWLRKLSKTYPSIAAKYPDVPIRLSNAIMSLESDERNVPHRYTFAAGYVIAEYLRMYSTGPESNSFFNFAEKAPDGFPRTSMHCDYQWWDRAFFD